MPDTLKSNAAEAASRAAKYRDCAETLRVMARHDFASEEARRIVLDTAEKYERLAASIEKLEGQQSEAMSRVVANALRDRVQDGVRGWSW